MMTLAPKSPLALSASGHDAAVAPKRGGKAPPAQVIDLNKAGKEELMQLPGIGPVLAERIMADRRDRGPFANVADLMRISGIKEKTLAKLRPHVRVEGDQSALAQRKE